MRRPSLSVLLGAAAAAVLSALGLSQSPASTPLAVAESRYARYRKTNDAAELAAAEAAVAKGLETDPGNYDLRKFRLRLLLPHHRFEELAAQALLLKQVKPDDAELDGALGDAYIEVGRYDEAFKAYDAFAAKVRSTGSLSRLAIAKDVVGDLPGALQDMDAAAALAGSDAEAFAWCRSRSARLLLKMNRYEDAEGRLVEALLRFPDHPASLAVAGEIAARKGMYDTSCRLAEKSYAIYPDFAVASALVDYREAMGDAEGTARAKAAVRTLEALLPPSEKQVHRLLALYEAEHGDAARAVVMTAKELETRKDMLGYDAYAWSLYRAGRAREGMEPMKSALAKGTIDPLLEFHAGAIAKAAGDEIAAKRHLERALTLDPRFHVKYAAEAKRMLEKK